jgi:hypothetical protein
VLIEDELHAVKAARRCRQEASASSAIAALRSIH